MRGSFYSYKSPLIYGIFCGDKIRKLFDSLGDFCISRKFPDPSDRVRVVQDMSLGLIRVFLDLFGGWARLPGTVTWAFPLH